MVDAMAELWAELTALRLVEKKAVYLAGAKAARTGSNWVQLLVELLAVVLAELWVYSMGLKSAEQMAAKSAASMVKPMAGDSAASTVPDLVDALVRQTELY